MTEMKPNGILIWPIVLGGILGLTVGLVPLLLAVFVASTKLFLAPYVLLFPPLQLVALFAPIYIFGNKAKGKLHANNSQA